MTDRLTNSVSRRGALVGLGAGGLGLALAAAARGAATQEAAAEMAAHPLVGLWMFDGTDVNGNGLNAGAAPGLWQPTGARTAEVLQIFRDTDPFPGGTAGPGTATFRSTAEVDATNTTVSSADATLDLRAHYGTHLFPPGPFGSGSATRVTFDVNPATGSTVAAPPATPEAASPTP